MPLPLLIFHYVKDPAAIMYVVINGLSREATQFKSFTVVANTIKNIHQHILNYLNNRSTNASAESFKAKDKALRRQFRGVRDVSTFGGTSLSSRKSKYPVSVSS